MNPSGFERIADNCDILIRLYGYLEFIDQLRLSRVNTTLQNIFEQIIWRDKYHRLGIEEPSSGSYVVTGSIGTSPLFFEYDEFQEFLDNYAENIEELTVNGLKTISADYIVREYPNLVKLNYFGWLDIPATHFSKLRKKCRNLEELNLRRCWMPTVKSLTRMKKLKFLTIDYGTNYDYRKFRQLCARVRLEGLHIKVSMAPEKSKRLRKVSALPLKELEISTTFNPEAWSHPQDFSRFMKNFENLQKLTIHFTDELITKDTLNSIAQGCENLRYFKIEHNNFHIADIIPLPHNLEELYLNFCRRLTYNNLENLLTQHKILKFTSKVTPYLGVEKELEISPIVQCLDVENVYTEIMKFSNLKELTWYDSELKEQDQNSLSLSSNLEILTINSGSIPLTILQQIKTITALTIPESMACLDWSYITALLRHSPLRHLTISGQAYRSPVCERSRDVPSEGFVSQITTLKIAFPMFQTALPFWLDLLRRNENLQLVCYHFKNFEEFLKKMLNDDNFPLDLRTIEIWGITLNCSKLRRHFDDTMNQFIHKASFLRKQYDHDGDLYRLILCRK
ncbi:uncharacterized protein LOC142234953 [Haematobia irritans]|uniref:uncharacterized protein LOC142234953 n=1 Tax=Haematobia irritans TaxID=7368 RepID=UPI003F5003A7